MSPLLKSVEAAGVEGLLKKQNPTVVGHDDFFNGPIGLKESFGKLINAKPQQCALIASVSYGMANAFANIPTKPGQKAITVEAEFPSDYFSLHRFCTDNGVKLETIKARPYSAGRGKQWNEDLLNAIDNNTVAVAISMVHWMDGTLYDMEAIGKRCKEVGAVFLVDGTQSVGALPIDVAKFQIDALIVAGYKWLMGPYSIGMAYYSEFFNNGKPIEESWMNRLRSNDFGNLTDYEHQYRPGAARYNLGESSNFILVPMLQKALDQLLEWEPQNVQNYCEELSLPLVSFLQEKGYWVENPTYRSKHLFGFAMPESMDREKFMKKLADKKVYLSLRSSSMRVSPHLYNTREDVNALIEVLDSLG
jgi:selenocysteine lyase/cysteine desulfurase